MKSTLRAFRVFALLLPLLLAGQPDALLAKPVAGTQQAWIYRGTDIPQDPEWSFGELPNGVRYAVRRNKVPPEQVSIRIRIDAGSLHEKEGEQGFAHLMEHLTFRQSKYLGVAQAIPTWQRLGTTFGSDTNAETSPTHTVYKIDLPGATPDKLAESFKLLSGMIREPVLNQVNVATEVPIVLAEKRERGGASARVADATRELFFDGQLLARRSPIGTEQTLRAATGEAVQAFHDRWYRPENTVIVVAGDAEPAVLSGLIKQWFADWKGKGEAGRQPDFGKPAIPEGADPANPVDGTKVLVEADLPRMLNYAVLRPYVQVTDNLEYNRGLMLDAVAQAIINRRLETRARAGGSYLFAQVRQENVSRSADGTFVSVTPLGDDWQSALKDVRAVVADALASAPSQEEIDREIAELDVSFASRVDERSVMAGSDLADDVVQATDIREAVATPEVVLDVFRKMKARFTPEAVLEHSRELFKGSVIRVLMVTPKPVDGGEAAVKGAMLQPAASDGASRVSAKPISFEGLPQIGKPGIVTAEGPLGLMDMEQLELSNGVRVMLWPNDAEPGRVSVKVRFGGGYRSFGPDGAPYALLGQMALVGSGVGSLGQEELDRIATGRKLGFDFSIDDAVFRLSADTRDADLADQLYLFAAKLAMPRWDANPVLRAKAAARLQYESFAIQPDGVLQRDLEWLLSNRDNRFLTPTPAEMEQVSPESFRKVWEPLLSQGPIEVMIFGDFKREPAIEALKRTFGALPPRKPLTPEVANRQVDFPQPERKPLVLYHKGDANQAAAVIAWPTAGGVDGITESRQLEILTQLFNNRLFDAMREHAGASYSPRVTTDWPLDMAKGGRIVAMAQLEPSAVPAFFAEAEKIAVDLAANPPSADELTRITEPLRQMVSRASTGNGFWMYNLDGGTLDHRRVEAVRTLLTDYSVASPDEMQALARRYLVSRGGWRLAVLPQGEALAGPGGTAAR
jgi:zinc protease